MTALSQELTKNFPLVVGISVADFRAALVAMGREMHDDTQATHQSLWTWWQWLDDEGYERQAFAEVLCQVGRTTIGDEAFAELTAYSKSIENDPGGISTLIEYTNKHYPDLTEEIAKIEKLAEEEENQIQNMAGGMSTRAKDTLIGIGAATGVGLAGLGIKGIHSYWKRTKAEREPRLVENVEIKATNDVKQETRKLENNAPDKENITRESAKTWQDRAKVQNEILIDNQNFRNETVPVLVGRIERNARETALFKLEHGTYIQTVAKEDRVGVMERIAEKFMPSRGEMERLAHATIQSLNIEGVTSLKFEEDELENEWIAYAQRAEIRKDRQVLGKIVGEELKPELKGFMKDSDIDTLYDLDKYIAYTMLQGRQNEVVKSAFDYWGGESQFAQGFAARHPSVKIGIREYIREIAMGDMSDLSWRQGIKNLSAANKDRINNYKNSKGYEKIKKGIRKDAENLAKKQEAEALRLEAEALQLEKTNPKAEVQQIIGEEIPELKKEAAEEVSNEQQLLDRETEKLRVEEQTQIRQKGMRDAAKKWDNTDYIAKKTAEKLKQKTNSIVNEDEELIKQAESDLEEGLIE